MVDRFHNEYKNGMDSSFSLRFGDMSWTTNPQTANQLAELGKRLNEGVKNVEIGALSQQVFDAIPKQHFEEIRRMAKMGEVELSLHAPLTDPAGFTQQGWQEHQRKLAEQEFKDVIDRAVDLNPEGGMPVNFHSSGGGIPAVIWAKNEKDKPEQKQAITAVNTRTGEIKLLPREKINWLDRPDKELTPERRLDSLNKSSWDQDIMNFMSLKKTKEEINYMQDRWRVNTPEGRELFAMEVKKQNGGKFSEEEKKNYHLLKDQDSSYDNHKRQIEMNMMSQLNNLYNDYVDSLTDEDKKNRETQKILDVFKEVKKRYIDANTKRYEFYKSQHEWEDKNKGMDEETLLSMRRRRELEFNDKLKKQGLDIAPEDVANILMKIQAPDRFRPVDDVAKEKAAETFANVALHAYQKHKDKAPLITVENVFPDWTLSRADSLRGLIEETKKKFVSKLKEEGVSETKAKELAEKNIGATWDVGHINQLRKYGYTKEDIIKESDHVLSTGAMIKFVEKIQGGRMIVATEIGMLHKLKKINNSVEYIPAGKNFICQDMKKITLQMLYDSINEEKHIQ